MKVIYTLFNQASGKLAGTVGSKNRGGNYMRSRVVPSNPRSALQARIRTLLASAAASWRSTLTGVQRGSWTTLAGDGVQTGENLYVAMYTTLKLGTGTPVTTAPATKTATFTPPVIGDITVEDDGNINVANLVATDEYNATAGGVILLFTSAPQSPSRATQQFGFQQVGYAKRAGAALTEVSGTEPDSSRYGSPGQVKYIRVVTASVLGKVSSDAIFRCTVAAH